MAEGLGKHVLSKIFPVTKENMLAIKYKCPSNGNLRTIASKQTMGYMRDGKQAISVSLSRGYFLSATCFILGAGLAESHLKHKYLKITW